MAGGSGTRFWPRSRVRAPKQLLPIVGGRSLLCETLARISPPVPRANVLVVTGRLQARRLRAQVPGVPASAVLVEPEARNTAPAIALAALHLVRRVPDAVMAVLPADHAVGDVRAFRADLRLAFDLAADTGGLVTFGVKPTHPETGYGYIRPGEALAGTRGRVARVAAFIEKPARERAEALLAEGGVLWNAGIFVWRAADVLDELRAHLPALVRLLEGAVRRGTRAALRAAYQRLPAISIDTGVLERSQRVLVVEASFPWSDVGSWAAVEPFWKAGENGANSVRGRALPVDSHGCVVDSPERLVALLGVDDLEVVDTPDAVLVCRKDRAQDVRLVVDALRRRGLSRYL
jgi:mannose-1-phosphate guanylyltransferase/mannose-6-phosphate isomerase